ncbi:hypothetical protein BHE74_00029052 [Ensete ventricosum]|nr:hypothetical protein BHE74_00029052 [Ensete ventricosum]
MGPKALGVDRGLDSSDLGDGAESSGSWSDLHLTVRTTQVKSEGDLPSLLEAAPQRVWVAFTESQEPSDFPFVLKKIGLGGCGYNITPMFAAHLVERKSARADKSISLGVGV